MIVALQDGLAPCETERKGENWVRCLQAAAAFSKIIAAANQRGRAAPDNPSGTSSLAGRKNVLQQRHGDQQTKVIAIPKMDGTEVSLLSAAASAFLSM